MNFCKTTIETFKSVEKVAIKNARKIAMCKLISVIRLGDILDFGQLFKAFGNI